jgi:hypothetical protein
MRSSKGLPGVLGRLSATFFGVHGRTPTATFFGVQHLGRDRLHFSGPTATFCEVTSYIFRGTRLRFSGFIRGDRLHFSGFRSTAYSPLPCSACVNREFLIEGWGLTALWLCEFGSVWFFRGAHPRYLMPSLAVGVKRPGGYNCSCADGSEIASLLSIQPKSREALILCFV